MTTNKRKWGQAVANKIGSSIPRTGAKRWFCYQVIPHGGTVPRTLGQIREEGLYFLIGHPRGVREVSVDNVEIMRDQIANMPGHWDLNLNNDGGKQGMEPFIEFPDLDPADHPQKVQEFYDIICWVRDFLCSEDCLMSEG